MADITLPDAVVTVAPSGTPRRRHAGLTAGLILLVAIMLLSLAAPLLTPHDPYVQDLVRRFLPPLWQDGGTWSHPLGTDALGRDYLARLLYGGRISLLVGIAAMVLSGAIGLLLGLVAGYAGGRVDLLITFIITTRLALPIALVALAAVALAGNSLLTVILVIGLLKWDRFAVVTRSATMRIRGLDFITAAEALGSSMPRILWREILPNILPQFTVVATLEVASAILLEAAFSFLGLGVPAPLPSWGLMIAEAKPFMLFDFWLIAAPGAALSLLVLAVNLVGDGISDLNRR